MVQFLGTKHSDCTLFCQLIHYMIFRSIFLLFIFLGPELIHAQNRQYDVVNYTTDNGLPQNNITGIQFDRKGYCWLGTQMGLVRFDGQRFTLFGSDNIKGLRSDRITAVARDTAGTVFARTGDIVSVLKINGSSSLAAPTPVLLSTPEPDVPTQGFAAPHSYLSTIKPHPAGQISFGTANGDMYFIQPGESYYITSGRKIPIDSFSGVYVENQLLFVDQNMASIRSYNNVELWSKQAKRGRPALYGPLWADPDFKKGNYTIPLNTEGAHIFTRKTLYRVSLVHDTLYSEVVLDGIEIPEVRCFYEDKRNNKFYFGSATFGLFVVTPTVFYTPPTPNNAPMDFYSQSVIEDGVLCQNILFRRDGSSKKYSLNNNKNPAWYRPDSKSLYRAPSLSLLRSDLATGKTYTIANISTFLRSIFPDPGQTENLVFCTELSIGKIIHDTITGEKIVPGLKKGQELIAIYPHGTDTFLMATLSGMKWYDYQRNKIYRSILDSITVREIYAESSQRIWIASYSKGWYLYDNGRIIRLPDGPKDALKTVNAIIDDKHGYFWLSSNNGLFKVSRRALIDYSRNPLENVYFYSFTTKDHLPTNEFNFSSPSYVWLSDSMLSLPTIKGLVWFYPYKIHLSLPDKGIFIEQIRVNQKDVFQTADRLDLAPDHGRLSVKVSSPYFGNKENMQLEFKIEGLEEEWHTVPENGEIMIDRMPAGPYSLVVRKISGMDQEQYVRLIFPIKVHPYWYHTWLFYLLLLIFSFIFVYWLIKLRTRLLQARNRKLQIQVALQTRDLNRMVYQLTQSEGALKQSNQTKDNIITTVLHDLRSPVRFIYTISKHIASDHQRMQQDALDVHLQELKNSTASLNSFTDQFFTWALSQHRTFSARCSTEPLADLFLETESLYADIMNANGNRLTVMPTELYCYTDPQLLATVIRNLLDNANKNTRNGVIKLATARSGNYMIITVSDTGKGFTYDALKAFLDKDRAESRNGKGSFIVLHLLELIGGSLEAISAPDKGTEFKIILRHQESIPDNNSTDD
jgi:signal transduction histidine kinase